MSWDYVVDKDGNLGIIVSRWYNEKGNREVRLIATGFQPYEPVQVEVCGEDESLAIKPNFKWDRSKIKKGKGGKYVGN